MSKEEKSGFRLAMARGKVSKIVAEKRKVARFKKRERKPLGLEERREN